MSTIERDLPPLPTEEPRPGAHRPRFGSGDPAGDDEFDRANKSLADALRLSFLVLQLVMVVLVLVYFASGWKTVSSQERGLRLIFGKIQDDDALEPGGYATWPYPIGQFITVPASPQTLVVDDAFWVGLSADEKAKPFRDLNPNEKQLRPGEDGSVITADSALAHTKWTVQYRIVNARRNQERLSLANVERVVRKAVERGVVLGAAVTTLDDVVQSRDLLSTRVKSYAQQMLDKMDSGIVIVSASYEAYPPRYVLEAYDGVNQATVQAAQEIEEADKEARERLNEVAGPAYQTLRRLVAEYDAALERAAADPALEREAAEVLARIDQALAGENVGGQVARVIGAANSDRAEIAAAFRNELERFRAWRDRYRENPELTLSLLWAETMGRVGTKGMEWFMLPPGVTEVDIRMNRNPERKRRMESERYEADLDDF